MKSSRSAQSESVPVKKTAKKTATPSAGRQKTSKVNQISKEEVARRAYFISERRRSLGMEGRASIRGGLARRYDPALVNTIPL